MRSGPHSEAAAFGWHCIHKDHGVQLAGGIVEVRCEFPWRARWFRELAVDATYPSSPLDRFSDEKRYEGSHPLVVGDSVQKERFGADSFARSHLPAVPLDLADLLILFRPFVDRRADPGLEIVTSEQIPWDVFPDVVDDSLEGFGFV